MQITAEAINSVIKIKNLKNTIHFKNAHKTKQRTQFTYTPPLLSLTN